MKKDYLKKCKEFEKALEGMQVVDGGVFDRDGKFLGIGCKTPDTKEEWEEHQRQIDEYIKEGERL